MVAPVNLREGMLALIRRETEPRRRGPGAHYYQDNRLAYAEGDPHALRSLAGGVEID